MEMINRITGIFEKGLVRNISALGLIQVGNILIPLLILPYLSRVIGVANYGELEFARTIVAYFTIFVDYGFNFTATREISIHRDNPAKINEIVTHTFAAKLLLLIISTFVFWGLIEFEDSYAQLRVLLWVTFIFNVGQFLFPIWYFQGIEKMAFVSILNFFVKLGVLVSVIFIISTKDQYWVYNLFLSISHLLFAVFTVFWMFSKFKVKLQRFRFRVLVILYKSGFSIFFSTLMVTIYASYAFVKLNGVVTSEEFGGYSSANKIVATTRVLIMVPFSQAFFPYITKLATENLKKFDIQLKKVSIFLTFIMLLISVFSFLFAEEIILLIFGQDYEVGATFLRVLCFLPLFQTLNNLFAYQGLLSLKKDGLFLKINIVFAVLIFFSTDFVINNWGGIGIAYQSIIAECCLMICSFYFYRKILNEKS